MDPSIIISVLALIVAISGFYLQHLHTQDAVTCVIAAYNFSGREPAVQLAVSNLGTRPILLRSARLLVTVPCSFGQKSFDPGERASPQLPLLIPKGEIASINISIKLPEEGKSFFSSWKELDALDSFVPYYARLIFITGSGKNIVSEYQVHRVRYADDHIEFLPSTKDNWQAIEPKLEAPRII